MDADLAAQRLSRLRRVMCDTEVEFVLTADPINITYATSLRNMNVFSMMGATRFLLIAAEGPVVMWEYVGAEHLAAGLSTIDEVRSAPGVTALSGPPYLDACHAFAGEIAAACDASVTSRVQLAVERMDEAMHRVEGAVEEMLLGLHPGATEIEVWSGFHRHLIAHDGEYVSTRLVQAGERTFPYFQEAGPHRLELGDLFCIDTGAIGLGGYAVDFSRTYLVGGGPAAPPLRELHTLSKHQLEHNAQLLTPGRSFADFAARAWTVPDRHAPYAYSCLAHGLGMSGEYPYVPVAQPDQYPLAGAFEAGMVVCVESYIGDAPVARGVKLENQYLITDSGAEVMSTISFDPAFDSPE
jgi:Xaa-Pro dipeptidase